MQKIKNWRDLIEKMRSNAYEYNNRQGPILDFKINEGNKSVAILHDDKWIYLTFASMETVLHRWKPIAMGPLKPYYHLADAEFEDEAPQKETSIIKPPKDKSDGPTPQDKLNTIMVDYLENLSKEVQANKDKINEALIQIKQDNEKGAAFARNQGKQIFNGIGLANKLNLTMLQAFYAMQKMVDQSKPPEEPESEP